MSRYEIIKKYEDILASCGCPLIINRYALTMDKQKNEVVAQIKFQNLDKRVIKAVYISIDCTGVDDEKLENLEEYVYLDLSVKSHDYFGGDVPVYLPNKKTREVKFACNKIIFENGDTWINNNNCAYNIQFEIKPLIDEFVSEEKLYTELKKELIYTGTKYSNLSIPFEKDVFRLCTCGELNLSDYENCPVCGQTSSWWRDKTNKEALRKTIDEFEEQQRIKEAEIAEKQAKIKEKTIKYGGITLGIIIAIFMIYYVYTNVIFPAMRYSEAEEYYSNGDYVNAITIYSELGDYKDSADKLSTVKDLKRQDDEYKEQEEIYNIAISWYEAGQYNKALEKFESVEGFPELTFYKGACVHGLKKYEEAITILSDVEDNSVFKDEAQKKIRESYYRLGVESAEKGELSDAKEYLKKTEYGNSKEILELIEQIESDNWVGIYNREDDENYWMQVLCAIKSDLTYTYEVYIQTRTREYYYKKLTVGEDGKIVMYDAFNDYNIENCGDIDITESVHQFQDDKSIYEPQKGGVKGYGGFAVTTITSKKYLEMQDSGIVMIDDRHVEERFPETNEYDETIQYVYIRQ